VDAELRGAVAVLHFVPDDAVDGLVPGERARIAVHLELAGVEVAPDDVGARAVEVGPGVPSLDEHEVVPPDALFGQSRAVVQPDESAGRVVVESEGHRQRVDAGLVGSSLGRDLRECRSALVNQDGARTGVQAPRLRRGDVESRARRVHLAGDHAQPEGASVAAGCGERILDAVHRDDTERASAVARPLCA
jgi:hypothetical protein